MKQSLRNMPVDGKKVIVRVDYNVPVVDGVILDDSKIKASLETIDYLVSKQCRVILLSHFGKVKTEADKTKNSLQLVAKHLKEMVSYPVLFSEATRSYTLELEVNALQPGSVLVLENTRFEDVPDLLESSCDMQLASYWASLGDVFVMDGFGSTHRKHASTYGIAKFIPSCVGFLVEKELQALHSYVLEPEQPFTIMMGGAKLDDKLSLLEKLLPKCSHMLLTGGLANTCLKALGLSIGESLASENPDVIASVQRLLSQYASKIVLPVDAVVGNSYHKEVASVVSIQSIPDDMMIGDIGPQTIEKFSTILNQSKSVFLNGTAGIYEEPRFSNGTQEMLRVLSDCGATVFVGGGDGCSAVRKYGYQEQMTYLSTGGGATLEYIVSGAAPALESIPEESEVL